MDFKLRAIPTLKGLYLVGLPLMVALSHFMLSEGASIERVSGWLIPLKCPVKWLTGLLCPTCGLGRSVLLSLNGDLSQALSYHFLGPVVALALLGVYLFLLLPGIYKASLLKQFERLWAGEWAHPKFYGAALLVIYCLWGVARNWLPGWVAGWLPGWVPGT